jgi:RNA polymerase sigma-70 factor (ECF subfamily)
MLEEELIAGLRDGSLDSEQAWSVLYAKYYQFVRKAAIRYGLNDADADDIVADVFISLPRLIRNYQARGSLKAYLVAVTRNRVYEFFRRERSDLHEDLTLKHEEEIAEASTQTSISRHVDNKQDKEIYTKIESAIARLSERDRLIITLTYLEGMSASSVAETLNLSPSAVRVSLHRARKRLRRVLEDEGVTADAIR